MLPCVSPVRILALHLSIPQFRPDVRYAYCMHILNSRTYGVGSFLRRAQFYPDPDSQSAIQDFNLCSPLSRGDIYVRYCFFSWWAEFYPDPRKQRLRLLLWRLPLELLHLAAHEEAGAEPATAGAQEEVTSVGARRNKMQVRGGEKEAPI